MLVDWLPWNHTFGGNHNVGIVLYNGGTLYIDDGKPTPALHRRDAAQPARDRADGLLQRAEGLRGDRQRAARPTRSCARRCFSRVQHVLLLRRRRWRSRSGTSSRASPKPRCGERIVMAHRPGHDRDRAVRDLRQQRTTCKSAHIGLPAPGIELKLVPSRRQDRGALPRPERHARLLARARADRARPSTTKASTAPATRCKSIDPAAPEPRLACSTAASPRTSSSRPAPSSASARCARRSSPPARPTCRTWWSTGINRNEVGALLFPTPDAAARLAGAARRRADCTRCSRAPPVQRLLPAPASTRCARRGTGSANRVARALVLLEPPSIDKGEITDKGSINQRAVLTHRAALVAALHDDLDARIIKPIEP